MPEAWIVPAAAVPLVVAFFNLVLAGQVARRGPDLSRRGALATGALGIAVFALAWFMAALEPSLQPGLRILASLGSIVAIAGFVVDALIDASRVGRAVAGALALVTFPAVLSFVVRDGRGLLTSIAVALFVATVAARIGSRGAHARSLPRRVSHAAIAAMAAYGLIAAVRAGVGSPIPDPSLGVLLAAQTISFVYVADHRIRPRVIASSALVYAVAFGLIAVAATAIARASGLNLDSWKISISVTIGLCAAVALVVVAEVVNAGLIRLIFPEQAKLSSMLGASKAEIAAIRRRLERAERLAVVGELAAKVAHEIKNPLSPIRSYAQILESRLDAVSEAERPLFSRGLGVVIEEADRIDARIRELLKVARAEKPDRTVGRSFDVNRVALEAAIVAESEEGPDIVPDLDPSAGLAEGDEDEIRGALSNLVENAKEASPMGARVEIKTRRAGVKVIVDVVDEGAGFEVGVEGRLYEPFFTTKSNGTGLGLSIAKSAVEAARGTLQLSAREDGRGTLARIELRAADDSQHAA
ncbi:MAG: hypothetical protein HY791_39040 [Deltaproteobacteria bacterium]|nr:hypothetical protein [Deltaproteobacteria bacterium]